MSGTTWQPWTPTHQALADELDRLTGVAPSASAERNLAEEDDDLSPEERVLADELDRYMKRPSREDEDRADRLARRDYTNLDAEGVSLALRLDQLTNADGPKRGRQPDCEPHRDAAHCVARPAYTSTPRPCPRPAVVAPSVAPLAFATAPKRRKPARMLMRPGGFEPPTRGLEVRRSVP